MPISAIVITLGADPCSRQQALAAIAAHPRLSVADLQRNQLPAVVETDTFGEGIAIVREWLPALEGVEFVHVVSVDFSDAESFDEKLPPRNKRRRSTEAN
jgi:hypothetical protein